MKKYTVGQLEFLREGYLRWRIPELTAAFNARFGTEKKPGQIKAALGHHKFRCGRPTSRPKGTYLIKYTGKQAEFIRSNYLKYSIAGLTARFNTRFSENKTIGQIRAFVNNHKCRSGRTGCFEKGHQPWNTGTKGLTSANVTSFKKGNTPPNRKPLGSERIDTKDGYILIKVSERDPHTGFPTRYRLKHVVIWEKKHGKMPPGHNIIFLDGDKLNCAIENLAMVSDAELARMNQMHYSEFPNELKPSILALARLKTITFKMGKHGGVE